jgi:hypothetical protein
VVTEAHRVSAPGYGPPAGGPEGAPVGPDGSAR